MTIYWEKGNERRIHRPVRRRPAETSARCCDLKPWDHPDLVPGDEICPHNDPFDDPEDTRD